MQQIDEVFDQLPYGYTMGRKSESDIFFIFTAEDKTGYRIRFRTAPNVGKRVRRVFVGEKSGENYSKTVKKFKNPLRVLATLIACFEHFTTMPIRLQSDGYAIFFPKLAGNNYDKLLKLVFKRSKVLRSRLSLADTKLQLEERGYYLWAVRKGKKPSEVFNGDAVRGVISDETVCDDDKDDALGQLHGECDDYGVLMNPPTRVTPFGVYLVLTGKGYFCEGIDENEITPRPEDQL